MRSRRSERAKDIEVIVLRHQLEVVRRQVERPANASRRPRFPCRSWRGPESSPKVEVEYAPLLHPTFPEGSKQPGAMKTMLAQWNQALPGLRNALSEHDDPPDATPYDTALKKSDRVQIPDRDMPAGTPDFMRSLDQWASREDLLPKGAHKAEGGSQAGNSGGQDPAPRTAMEATRPVATIVDSDATERPKGASHLTGWYSDPKRSRRPRDDH
jgi:hypothetical protein